jgi:hypothetical protein
MNYNAIDIDEEIAFVGRRSRGGPYPRHARMGTVLDKRKVKRWQNKSMTGQVLVETKVARYSYYRDEYSREAPKIEDELEEIWIDAYTVIDFWDRYEQEREHLYGEELRRLEEQERERLDREAARLEEIKRKERRMLDLKEKIEFGFSLPKGSVTINDFTVTINRDVLETRFLDRIMDSS